ncbi:Type VI secretion system tip protein VgrG [Sulfidibacter corallicola]|uniref:Type VI secretion system tip protein VgrG n=1 Tax=Sulfidibacter corallicola TaxID=2818388 RepID=A0A8A4TR94_SULCO|nr:type VI secretion system tip protein TssI/VgrG [Sulfidibacter corallicola]QTD52070.1 type VI secretion system tip protein VgrG [Sulfidibacter corallicola]
MSLSFEHQEDSGSSSGGDIPTYFHQNNTEDLLWQGPGGPCTVVEMQHSETLSEPALTRVTLRFGDVLDPQELLHRQGALVLKAGEQQRANRFFSGVITQVSQSNTVHHHLNAATRKSYVYTLEMRPRLYLLSRVRRSRVYQKMTVPEIVTALLRENGIVHEWRLQGHFKAREYCVQYNESNLDFIQRLLEAEGIYFFYDHEQGKLILVDYIGAHTLCQPTPHADYVEGAYQLKERDREGLLSARYSVRLDSGRVACHDYNYQTSQINLTEDGAIANPAVDTALEVYLHNTLHADNDGGASLAKLEREIIQANLAALIGEGNCRSFAVGFLFELQGHFDPSLDKRWMLTEIEASAQQGSFHCRYKAVPGDVIFRKARTASAPKVRGLQTAVVTGPEGSEVYLDDLGRCKVQFHWDREGERNDRSSMWVRVNNNYAGKNYGMQFIPRVGHEVLIEFLEGNPDHPVVIGRVYNDDQAPPLGPAQKYQNGFKTIKDHHFIMDDIDGKELVDLRSARDMKVEIVHDDTETIGNDQSIQVGANQSQSIGANQTESVGVDRTISVGRDDTLTVNRDRSTTIVRNEEREVLGNHRKSVAFYDTESVGISKFLSVAANYVISSPFINRNANMITETVSTDMTLNIGETLTITCGASSLTLAKDGTVTLAGTTININGSNRVQVQGGRIDLN